MNDPVRIGISSCILGNPVRFDGGHKLDRYIVNTLGQYVDYVPVCPEVECGLPIPRDSLRLVGTAKNPRLVTRKTGEDHTERMQSWGKERIHELATLDLCGFIFKSKSPSSGMERVRIYTEDGNLATKTGVGIFAKMFMDAFPLIPTEEEGRLHDPRLRENFITRIFAMKRWRECRATGSMGALVKFHTRHKLQLMGHSVEHYREMGRLVAEGKKWQPEALLAEYEQKLMTALTRKSTTAKNTNVLQHMMGYFKKSLSADEKRELMEIIETYHSGRVPLIVPLTLLQHYVRKYDEPYLKEQVFLEPHPAELALRNHV